jgi:hypothetical protein
MLRLRRLLQLFVFILCVFYLSATTEKASVQPYGKPDIADDVHSLQVDLGYSIYRGFYDTNSRLNIWQG